MTQPVNFHFCPVTGKSIVSSRSINSAPLKRTLFLYQRLLYFVQLNTASNISAAAKNANKTTKFFPFVQPEAS